MFTFLLPPMGSSRHLQSAHELKSCADQADLAVELGDRMSYFEYSSTISCSLTGRLISSRFGNESTLPLSFSRSIESHAGAGWPLANCCAPSITVILFDFSRTLISS